MNPNRPARLNRALLAVVGLVLLLVGVGGLPDRLRHGACELCRSAPTCR